MRSLTVVGLTSDGLRLVLRAGNDTFELALRDVPTSRQPSLPFADQPPPTPRQIQERIRAGETAADIAEQSGVPLERVVKFEGPILAEREHQAGRAQRARIDGRLVGELVAEHMARMAQDPEHLQWDAWLLEPGRWEVRAQCGREVVRLAWQPATVRVSAIDEAARHALRLGPVSDDALGAVLRPVSGRPVPPPVPPLPVPVAAEPEDVVADAPDVRAEEPPPAPAPRPAAVPRRGSGRKRAAVPAWDDITAAVAGRLTADPEPEH